MCVTVRSERESRDLVIWYRPNLLLLINNVNHSDSK